MVCRTISRYVDVDVDIDLSDFDDEDLIDELESRGFVIGTAVDSPDFNMLESISQLHQLRRTGQDYQQVLDRLIYESIGKIV